MCGGRKNHAILKWYALFQVKPEYLLALNSSNWIFVARPKAVINSQRLKILLHSVNLIKNNWTEFLCDALLQVLRTNAQRWVFIQSNASILQTMKRASVVYKSWSHFCCLGCHINAYETTCGELFKRSTASFLWSEALHHIKPRGHC